MIKKTLDKDIKEALKMLLRIKPHERPNIKQVLRLPVFTKNLSKFSHPISKEDFEILIRNFVLNSGNGQGRRMPDVFHDGG